MSEGKANATPNGDDRGELTDGLTAKQHKALTALIENPTLAKAAEASGIGERTLRRYMDDPAFAQAFRKARRESFTHAISMASHYSAHAIQTLGRTMTDQTTSAQTRVSAAKAILTFGRESIELDDLAARVETLERLSEQDRGHRR